MKSETTKLFWILISITVFLIAITGTAVLVLGGKNSKNNSSTNISIVDTESRNETKIILPIDETEIIETKDKNQTLNENLPLAEENLLSDTEKTVDKIEREIEETTTGIENKPQKPYKIIDEQKRTKATVTQKATKNYSIDRTTRTEKVKPIRQTLPIVTKPIVKKQTSKKQPIRKSKVIWIANYWIQAGSFNLLSGAEKNQKDLKGIGIQSTITTKVIKDKTFYRLRIGPFNTKNEAEQYLKKLKSYKKWKDSYISKTTTKKTR